MRCLSAAFLAEADIGLVEVEIPGQQQKGHGAAECAVGQLEYPLVQHRAAGGGQVVVAEQRAQERREPLLDANRGRSKIGSRTALRIAAVEIVANAPIPRKFLLDREGSGQTVIGAGLLRRFQRGNGLEKLGRQYAAFNPERREPAAFSRAGHAHKLAMGMKT